MARHPSVHRKTVQHFDADRHVHELTFSCYQRLQLLTNESWRGMLALSIGRALTRHNYRLAAFVFMPEHVHLLAYPLMPAAGVAELLKAIKRPFSFRVKKLLAETDRSLFDRLTVRQRPGVRAFRFWQEGPGYDRNLTDPATTLAAIDYIHMNPVRRGLVQRTIDWRWSSARHYSDRVGHRDEELPPIDGLPSEWLNETQR